MSEIEDLHVKITKAYKRMKQATKRKKKKKDPQIVNQG
jgi:hypothetical protein